MYRTTGYDRTLNQIRGLCIEMGRSVTEHLKAAINTLDRPIHTADWRDKDRLIDKQRDHIINRCYSLMSLQQLRNRDLRWILGYQRIAQEFERIGDYACDIAEISTLHTDGDWPDRLQAMGKHLVSMCEYVVKLMDEALLEKIDLIKEDDFLDEGYATLRLGMSEPETGKQKDLVWGLILIQARTLERMGDHVVNIVEALEFIEKGDKNFPADPTGRE